MYLILLILVMLWFVINALFEVLRKGKKPLESPLTEKERMKYYRKTCIVIWSQALVVIILCLFVGIRFYDIGLRGISLNQNIWFTSVTLILCGIYSIAHIYEMAASLASPKYRKEQKKKLAKRHSNDAVGNMLPRSKKERRYWSFVALTAGVGEEIVCRGFLIFLLQAVFPNMPILFILAAASAVFGIAHAYQGVKGIRNTAIVGALHGCLFLVTGSLILPMLMHFIVDISSVFTLAEDTEVSQHDT